MTHEADIKKDSVRMEAFAYYFKMVQMCFGESAYTPDFVFKVCLWTVKDGYVNRLEYIIKIKSTFR